MRDRIRFILAVSLQIVILLTLIGMKWYTLTYGTKILLKTRPVDPWDFFRGDYVNLNYEISRLNLKVLPHEGGPYKRNQTVYVKLQQVGKYWEARSLHNQPPDDGSLFIKGIVQYHDNFDYNDYLVISYGIESFYVPEHQGREIETSQILPDVEVSVDSSGNAAISRLFINGKEFGKIE